MRLAAGPNGRLEVGQHLGGLQMAPRFMDHDFHAGVFQIDQPLQRGVQRQVGKTSGGSGNKHGQIPRQG